MSNMSYCRFQNTLADLEDCQDNFTETESVDEAQAAIDLYRLCLTIVRTYSIGELEEQLEELQQAEKDEDEDEDGE